MECPIPSDFADLDFSALHEKAYSSDSPEEQLQIYKYIVHRAKTDSTFRATIDYKRFIKGSRRYSHLLNYGTNLSIAILGYKVPLMGQWDPFDTATGLPGSEECAVYASQELAHRGHRVVVYLDPPDKSIWRSKFSNPQWLPEDFYYSPDNKAHYDLVLMWRRGDVDTGRMRANKVFFWPHDSPPIPPSVEMRRVFPRFDGLCMLSKHQYGQYDAVYAGLETIPSIICGNGVVLDQFTQPMSFTNPYSIGYFSNYARGLLILMIIWPEIKRRFPLATLSICYGRETWNTMSQEQFDFVIKKIDEYKSLGVIEHGKVGHEELASIMQNTSVWAYPCTTTGETFCITAVKAQLAGMIPVVTRIGALDETVHPDAPSSVLIHQHDDMVQYANKLLTTLMRIRDCPPEQIRAERLKYVEFAKQFSWVACVDKWLALLDSIKSGSVVN